MMLFEEIAVPDLLSTSGSEQTGNGGGDDWLWDDSDTLKKLALSTIASNQATPTALRLVDCLDSQPHTNLLPSESPHVTNIANAVVPSLSPTTTAAPAELHAFSESLFVSTTIPSSKPPAGSQQTISVSNSAGLADASVSYPLVQSSSYSTISANQSTNVILESPEASRSNTSETQCDLNASSIKPPSRKRRRPAGSNKVGKWKHTGSGKKTGKVLVSAKSTRKRAVVLPASETPALVDREGLLPPDHRPARGRGRSIQLSSMTKEQIAAETVARNERNRQAAKECRRKRKEHVELLEARVEKLESVLSGNRKTIAELRAKLRGYERRK